MIEAQHVVEDETVKINETYAATQVHVFLESVEVAPPDSLDRETKKKLSLTIANMRY